MSSRVPCLRISWSSMISECAYDKEDKSTQTDFGMLLDLVDERRKARKKIKHYYNTDRVKEEANLS